MIITVLFIEPESMEVEKLPIFLVSNSDDAFPKEVAERLGFKSLREFVEDLAVAETKDGQFLYVRRDYTPLNDETYEEANDFRNGFGAVKKDGKCYHVRKLGGFPAYYERYEWVLDFEILFDLVRPVLLALVKELDNGKNKGKTFKISTNGKRFYPLAPKAQ